MANWFRWKRLGLPFEKGIPLQYLLRSTHFMRRRMQINLILYCFFWHLIWLIGCSQHYRNDGNSCCVKRVPFTQSINYRPIVALLPAKIKQATVSTSPGFTSTDFVSITASYRVTEPIQLAAEPRYLAPCSATAHNPPQLLPSRAPPA